MSVLVTSKATLVACFICKKQPDKGDEPADALWKMLLQEFELDPVPNRSGRWQNTGTTNWLVQRDLASDVAYFILALNAPIVEQRAESAWDDLRAKLEAALPAVRLQGLVGYTLIYQGELGTESTPADAYAQAARHALALHATPLPAGSVPSKALATSNESSGTLWLLATPRRNLADRATVYLALGPADRADELVVRLLLSTERVLLPDLIAHKAYYHIRQYRAPLVGPPPETLLDRYRAELAGLRAQAGRLRAAAVSGAAPTTDLSDAINRHNRLADAHLRFDELRVALAQQRHNYGTAITTANLGGVGQCHQLTIEAAHDELTMLVDEGVRPLEAARAAIELVRAALERENQQQQVQASNRQQVVGLLIAIAAAGLTVAQVMNLQVVAALAIGQGIAAVTSTDLNSLTPGTLLRLFVAQMALVILLVLLFVAIGYGVWWVWNLRQRRRRATTRPVSPRNR